MARIEQDKVTAGGIPDDLRRFILTSVPSVPYLEAILLLRGWRKSGSRLLFWSALCFAGLSVNNFLLVIDKLVLPAVDLSLWRLAVALAAPLLLLFGLIWEEE